MLRHVRRNVHHGILFDRRLTSGEHLRAGGICVTTP